MNPWHRTPAFWLAASATAYCAMAGAWAMLPAAWQPGLPVWLKGTLATVGCLLPGAAAFAKVIEAPRSPLPPAPPASNDFHQGDTP